MVGAHNPPGSLLQHGKPAKALLYIASTLVVRQCVLEGVRKGWSGFPLRTWCIADAGDVAKEEW